MNNLFSGLFSSFRSEQVSPDCHHVIEMTDAAGASGAGGKVNLDKFFDEVEGVKDDLKELEVISRRLKKNHEQRKKVCVAKGVSELHSRMDDGVSVALKRVKMVKLKLEALERSNATNQNLLGCGPQSSSDRTRSSVVIGLKKKLKDSKETFNRLRELISLEYREIVQLRYFTVTGENLDDETLDLLISTGESETFLQKAIQEQGRGRIIDTINEIHNQERHDAVKELEKSLMELHQVFLDMIGLVQFQDEQLDDIEIHVARASSIAHTGAEQLQIARKHQKNRRKWTCYCIILLLIIVLFVVIFILKPWQINDSGGGWGGQLVNE